MLKIGLLLPIVAILIGLVGAASYLVSRIPSMRKTIEKLAMYQAGIGAAGAVIGILQGMDILFSSAKGPGVFMLWLVAVLTCFSCVLVGLILGYPLLQSIILDDLSEESRKKAEGFRNAIAPFQILCGLMALGGGFYLLIKVII
jgi:hypothetical protein